MSEIKRTFQAGKMNKDLDERIVPNGEYRDALNIQIRTSDGDDVGTVQNLKSTHKAWDGTDKNNPDKSYYRDWMGDVTLNINSKPSLPEVIGSIADEKNDKIYFFIKAPNFEDTIKIFTDDAYNAAELITSERKFSDCVLEYNVKDSTESPVVVDNFAIINTFAEINPSHPDITGDSDSTDVSAYTRINVSATTGGINKYRPGMTIRAVTIDGTDVFPSDETVRIKNYESGVITLYGEHTKNIFNSAANSITHFIFEHEDRPLNFSSELTNININAINVIDNLLFFTDNTNEPKKINIDRCKEGSDGFYIHTKLCVINPTSGNQQIVTTSVDQGLLDYPNSPWLKEEHVTVMRKAPTYAPTLDMSINNREGSTSGYFDGFAFTSSNIGDVLPVPYNTSAGDTVVLSNDIFLESLFTPGDIIRFYQTDAGNENVPVQLVAKFLCYEDYCGNDTCTETDCTEDIDGDGEIDSGVPSNAGNCQVTNRLRLEMVSVDPSLNEFDFDWKFELQQRKPLHELKMGRFGYRYKYEDGEYSTFSPWSELAFLPGEYDYQSRKGYNLGMVNTIRELIIKNFIPYPRPLDVKAVDILWKTTDSPSVYVVTTVERAKDSEWEEFTTDTASNNIKKGELHITSEMIHKVLPSSQVLRSWDSVPRKALAQEIVGNRLLYGNYVQGYDFKYPISLVQKILSDTTPSLETPKKSIKTLRDYKFGMVFGDKYGRETPVITSGYIVPQEGDEENPYLAFTGDVRVPKTLSEKRNSIELTQKWSNTLSSANTPHDWIEYVKYYVKEPSNEYYNLVMDRWYWCEDEQRNIWLSFNSADRNKIDEESYLILKNKHNSHEAVLEEARYKVLAIENDVPAYVKNVQLDLEKCPMTEAANGVVGFYGSNWTIDGIDLVMWDQCVGASGTSECQPPFRGKTTKKLYVGVLQWNIHTGAVPYNWTTGDMGTISHPLGKIIEGQLKIRIRSKWNGSSKYLNTRWQNVSSYRLLQSTFFESNTGETLQPEMVEFSFSEPFGEEIDMYTRWKNIIGEENLSTGSGVSCCDGNVTIPGLTYYIELREDVEEHKAEYDGKFFAKIEGDGVVMSSVVGATTSSQEYAVRRSFPIHYITSSRNGSEGDQIGGLFNAETNFETDYFGAFPPSDNGITSENIESTFGGTSAGCLDTIQDDQTKVFWESFRDFASQQHNGGTNTYDIVDVTFLDDARMVNGSMPDGSGFINEGGGTDDGAYTPSAFDVGNEEVGGVVGASEGMGRMTLSYLGDSQLENGDPHPGDLKYELMQVGAIFRWAGDPENEENIYEVVAFYDDDADSNANGYGSNYIDDDSGTCVPCNTNNMTEESSNACQRRTYQIEFRKIELFTGELLNSGTVGMQTTSWDPRSNMNHWGDGYQVLEIMQLRSSSTTITGEVRDGAVWETEPKEGTELDIYYEASDAIPVNLNEDNIYNFAPIDSGISVLRPDDSGSSDTINLPNTSLYRSWIGDLKNNQAIVHIRTQNETTGAYDDVNNVLKGDDIRFHHKNGTITRSKVTDIAKYASDSYDEDSLSSTFVKKNTNVDGYLIQEYAGDSVFVGNDANIFLYTVAGETRTITDDDGVEQIVPKVWLTSYNTNWSDYNVVYNQIYNVYNAFENGGITANSVCNDEDGGWDLPNNCNDNTLPSDASVTINGMIGGDGVAFGSEVTSAEGFATQVTLDENGDIVVIPSPSETNDQNQFDIVGAEGGAGYPIFVQVTLNDYSLFPTNEDGDYMGVLWFLQNLSSLNQYYFIDTEVYKYPTVLGWHNCWAFGNGAESDRVRDDYNAPQIDNGVKASTTFSGYSEETKGSGMIYSGLYNSISEVNDLNEFNISQKITKNLNPAYGSIQALKTRDTDVVVLAEDKILKVLANKDALYNADGNPQLTATDKVLGTAVPFVGDYGISKNPESLAFDQFRMYFTDKQRGAVLRLSRDGLTPISNVGMKTYFRENLPKAQSLLGTFDIVSGEYNLTLHGYDAVDDRTVSFNEGAKGWVSFKSFIPNAGESTSGKYITAYNYELFDHYRAATTTYNEFYGTQYESSIKLIFNDLPGSIKSFKTINYEGSQSKVNQAYDLATGATVTDANGNVVDTEDEEYYNLSAKEGWYVSSFETDLQSGSVSEFIDKEGKWFNKINGITTETSNIDTSEFTVQGIGGATWVYNYSPLSDVPDGSIPGCTSSTACNYDPTATFNDGSCNEPASNADCDGVCLDGFIDLSDGNGCVAAILGCTNDQYVEYNPEANTGADATYCLTLSLDGCMDENACNYNSDATQDPNDSCQYNVDCNGECGGSAVVDECGVCEGDNSTCAGCDGIPNSGLVLDICGVCDGDGTSCLGCDGVANSGLVLDACGVCGGDGTGCLGCDGIPNSGLVLDECGVCGGSGPAEGFDCDGNLIVVDDGIPDNQIWSISNYTDDSSATIEGVCGEGQVWDAAQGICVDD